MPGKYVSNGKTEVNALIFLPAGSFIAHKSPINKEIYKTDGLLYVLGRQSLCKYISIKSTPAIMPKLDYTYIRTD